MSMQSPLQQTEFCICNTQTKIPWSGRRGYVVGAIPSPCSWHPPPMLKSALS